MLHNSKRTNSPRNQSVSIETANIKLKTSLFSVCASVIFFIWEMKSHHLSQDTANKIVTSVCFHFSLHGSKQCRKFCITLWIWNSQPSVQPLLCCMSRKLSPKELDPFLLWSLLYCCSLILSNCLRFLTPVFPNWVWTNLGINVTKITLGVKF